MSALKKLPPRFYEYWVRKSLGQKGNLRWWLVYGAARSGTTYMIDLIAKSSRLWVSDWCLEHMLKLVPDFDYIRFDKKRALKEISANILDNAYWGGGRQIDLVAKEANMEPQEYESFVRMWGKPARTIFCFRQPAGYIHSAGKHFVGPYEISMEELQEIYVRLFQLHAIIGGDIFEYRSDLRLNDYIRFLKPLRIDPKNSKDFVFKGEDKNEHTTEAMWEAYNQFKKKHAESLKLQLAKGDN